MIIFIVFAAILFIILSSTVFKMHPLVGLLLAAIGVGIFAGSLSTSLQKQLAKGLVN